MQKPIDVERLEDGCVQVKDTLQPYGLDCGVFMCKTADYISQDAQLDFTITDMNYLRRRMTVEIMNGRVVVG